MLQPPSVFSYIVIIYNKVDKDDYFLLFHKIKNGDKTKTKCISALISSSQIDDEGI